MSDWLTENLAALDAAAAAALRSAGSPVFVSTADGLRLRTADGRLVRLHSARDPEREATGQLSAALAEHDVRVVAILGAGEGHLLERLDGRPDVRAIVIEPFADGAAAWLRRRSWVPALERGRILPLVGPAYAETAAIAGRLAGVGTHVPVVSNPVLVREYPEAMLAARLALDRVLLAVSANQSARERFEDAAFANTMANLPTLLGEGDVEAFASAFVSVPALILGAGPSLNRNLEALTARRWPGVTVAVDTALQPCLAAGVAPDIVVGVDPSAGNARNLDGRWPSPDTFLVAEASLDPKALRAFAGRTFFYRVGDHAPWPWLVAQGVDRGRLQAWGSVVTAGVDLAQRAGCSPIVFAGLDLAWTVDAPYCRHTIYEDDWAREVVWGRTLGEVWRTALANRQAVHEPALDGAPQLSTLDLVAFRDWLRGYVVAHPETTFVNGTGAGILSGPGIAQHDLATVLASFPDEGRDLRERLRACHTRRTARGPSPKDLAERIRRATAGALLDGHSAPGGVDPDRLAHVRQSAMVATRTAPAGAAGTLPLRAATPRPALPLPEQVEQMRRWLPVEGTVPVPADAPEPRARARAWLAAAWHHGVALAEAAEPSIGVAADVERLPTLPAPLVGTWTPAARTTVAAFGDCLAASLAAATGAETRTPAHVPVQRSLRRHRDDDCEPETARALFGLGWQWCWHAAAVDRPAPVDASRLSLLVGPFGAHTASDPTGARVLFDGEREPPRLPIVSLERERLSPSPLPRRHHVAQLDAERVLLPRDDGTGSDVMDERGRITASEPWPRPVSSELPCGEGRVAWDRRTDACFLWRHVPGAPAEVMALPVLPYDMCVRGDDVFLATSRGLWRWSATRGLEHVGGDVPLYVVHAQPAGLRAFGWPPERADGRRAMLVDAWDWDDRVTLRRHTIRTGQAVYDVSLHGAWRAEAWSDLDLIRIVHASGAWWWLTAPMPRKLGWAGSSLVATLLPHADVVRFPNLLDQLEPSH